MAKFIITSLFIGIMMISTIYGSFSTDFLHTALQNMHDKKDIRDYLREISLEKLNELNADGENSAHVTMKCGNFVCANLLVAYGVDLTHRNKQNKRPIDCVSGQIADPKNYLLYKQIRRLTYKQKNTSV